MSVYQRYKKDSDGFRKIVQLMEVAPTVQREKMLRLGQKEDPEYTKKILQHMMVYEDFFKLPDMELAEVISACYPQALAALMSLMSKEDQERILKNAVPNSLRLLREQLEYCELQEKKFSSTEIEMLQLKLIGFMRALERAGKIRVKIISASIK